MFCDTHARRRRERTMATIFYVLIPADSSEPMLDLQLPVPATLEENIGCLTKTLNGHYSRVAPIGQAAVDSMRTQLLSKSDASTKAPDEAMLGMLAQSQTVDIVQLLPATAASGFFGVNMYVDDKGQAKQSPINERASAVCTACGMPTEVRGDAFVAKVWDDQDGFVRHDLRVRDLASDAPWVLEAKQRNVLRANPAQLAEQMSQLKSMGQAAPKLPLAERLAAATSAKAAGTDLFKQGDVAGAVTKYFEAIDALGGDAGLQGGTDDEQTSDKHAAAELLLVCLINVAMCRLKEERPYDAIEACDRAIALDEQAGKAWYRRGQACMALEQYGAARKNLTRAATLLPNSKEIREEHARCMAAIAEKPASFAL